MNLINDFITKSAEKTIEKQEEIILSALPEGITPKEVSKRCK